ncbi:hypothetical protein [Nostoc sp. CCY0012]|uniref:hypothetical protein n=1 Tax=Nostoc sp. CCY0012 TaxID=1056123 RepID=UPI0039C6311E
MSNSNPQSQPHKLTPDSNSVQSYLNILQGVIARMANNSASCKTWCISLVSAILVVLALVVQKTFWSLKLKKQ